jgi:hypothetical protein
VSKTSYFSTRELVFAAMTVVAMQIWTIPAIALTLPAELSLGAVGLSSMAVAPVCSALLAIALVRLRRRGSLLLVTGLYAAIAAMGPGVYVALFVLIGGLVAEAVNLAIFGGYRTRAAVLAGPTLYHLAMFPATLVLRAVGLLNNPLGQIAPWLYAASFASVGILAFLGGLAKLRVEEPSIRVVEPAAPAGRP